MSVWIFAINYAKLCHANSSSVQQFSSGLMLWHQGIHGCSCLRDHKRPKAEYYNIRTSSYFEKFTATSPMKASTSQNKLINLWSYRSLMKQETRNKACSLSPAQALCHLSPKVCCYRAAGGDSLIQRRGDDSPKASWTTSLLPPVLPLLASTRWNQDQTKSRDQ